MSAATVTAVTAFASVTAIVTTVAVGASLRPTERPGPSVDRAAELGVVRCGRCLARSWSLIGCRRCGIEVMSECESVWCRPMAGTGCGWAGGPPRNISGRAGGSKNFGYLIAPLYLAGERSAWRRLFSFVTVNVTGFRVACFAKVAPSHSAAYAVEATSLRSQSLAWVVSVARRRRPMAGPGRPRLRLSGCPSAVWSLRIWPPVVQVRVGQRRPGPVGIR